ncbi:hypothetical protein Rs2_21339 [Raphanus sativus]|nr:hypothetical protein Rs2_21339 [Raphanus sativus]
MRQDMPPDLPFQNHVSRGQQPARPRRESAINRVVGSSRASERTSSRGSRRKKSFQTTLTDTMDGFREFQRQSLQQLRPDFFDQDNYDECDRAVKIFESMDVPKNSDFYWACIKAFKDDIFWRKYFIDRTENIIEDKLQFLQALNGYTPNNDFVGKRLASSQNSGSPNFSGSFSGSPSSGGNNSWGQTSGEPWGQVSQQWGTPPNAQQ